jgi:hypothetical protein
MYWGYQKAHFNGGRTFMEKLEAPFLLCEEKREVRFCDT